MEWFGELYDMTNWCRLGVTWEQTDWMSSHSAPSMQVSIAALKGLVQVSMPTSVTELTNALSPEQYEDLSSHLPTREDLRYGEVDLGELLVGQETMAPSFVPLLPSGTVVDPLQKTPTRLSSTPDIVSESACRECDVPIDESSVAPGSRQTSVGSLENADPATVRRRIAGKRSIIPPVLLALSDNVDSVCVNLNAFIPAYSFSLYDSCGSSKWRRVFM